MYLRDVFGYRQVLSSKRSTTCPNQISTTSRTSTIYTVTASTDNIENHVCHFLSLHEYNFIKRIMITFRSTNLIYPFEY